MIRMRCGGCRHYVTFEEEQAGEQANCPHCGAMLQVPLRTDVRDLTRAYLPVVKEEFDPEDLIKFFCHFCGQRLGFPPEHAGELRECMECGKQNRVPRIAGSRMVTAQGGEKMSWSRRLFPLVVLLVVGLLGALVWQMTRHLEASQQSTEVHRVGEKLGFDRTETLELHVSGGDKAESLTDRLALVGQLEIRRIDSHGVPVQWVLTASRYATENGGTKTDHKAVVGKQLLIEPDGTLKLDEASDASKKLMEEHNERGGPAYHHLTKWHFCDRSFLNRPSDDGKRYQLAREDGRRALTSALFSSIDLASVECRPTASGDNLTLAIEFHATGVFEGQQLRLDGTGELVFHSADRLISSLSIKADIKGSDFRQSGDSVKGTWALKLSKKRVK